MIERFSVTFNEIDKRLAEAGYSVRARRFVFALFPEESKDKEDVDISSVELVASSLEGLAIDLRKIIEDAQKTRKIYEYLRDNKLDFAEFEEMAHLLLD